MRTIQSMADQSGNPLFPHSFFVEVTTPDPQAPAEWNLANANGYWSLQIAAYKDSPKRKQYAVEAVRERDRSHGRHGIGRKQLRPRRFEPRLPQELRRC